MKQPKEFSKGVFATGLWAILVGAITLALPISGAGLAALAIAAPGFYLAGGEVLDYEADKAAERRRAERAAALAAWATSARDGADTTFPSFADEKPLAPPAFVDALPEAAIATPEPDPSVPELRPDAPPKAPSSPQPRPPARGIVDVLGR
ncbi:MAG: hypothetical protein KDD82_26545 [Planctomycetes bacterium]|nr:hypothetical protein [Planctomycetota bacterium]